MNYILVVALVMRTLSPWLCKSSPVREYYSIANSITSSNLSVPDFSRVFVCICGMILVIYPSQNPEFNHIFKVLLPYRVMYSQVLGIIIQILQTGPSFQLNYLGALLKSKANRHNSGPTEGTLDRHDSTKARLLPEKNGKKSVIIKCALGQRGSNLSIAIREILK